MNLYYLGGAALWTGAALLASNWVHRRSGNFVFSRKLAHGLIGLLILGLPVMFQGPLAPVVLAGTAFLVLTATRHRLTFHGVANRGRLSEIYFAGSLVACFASGWWVDPYIGVTAGLFLAWGDGITGLVRYPVYRTQFEKGWAGSLAMLGSCLAIAALVDPYWIGAAAAVVATVLEKQRWVDDNITVPLGSLGLMWGLAVL